MQCLTSINKNLIASNNWDIFYNLQSLVLLDPTGILLLGSTWLRWWWDKDNRREGDGGKRDRTNGPFISKLHKYAWGHLLLKYTVSLSRRETLLSSSSTEQHCVHRHTPLCTETHLHINTRIKTNSQVIRAFFSYTLAEKSTSFSIFTVSQSYSKLCVSVQTCDSVSAGKY